MLATDRRRDAAALLVFAALACWLLRDGFQRDHVLISKEVLQHFLPWSAVMEPEPPYNRYLVDQAQVFYPYLREAARIYAGEVDALWTSRGGGGQPFFGNISSSLLHPLTLLCAVLPIELVPLAQALAVLTLSAFFTWLFLRRLNVSVAGSALGAVAFGFGGHQVFWLQYALSHALLALPFTFWAVERVVEDRSRRRVAVLALGFGLLVLAGHPETGFVSGLVAGLWALYRLWDSHGRTLVVVAGLLGLAVTAVQWLPFLEYARLSRGLHLRAVESAGEHHVVSFGASVVYGALFLMAAALLRSVTGRGLVKRVLGVAAVAVVVVMARRMGMAVAAGVAVLPQMYGDPVGGGAFTGAQDFPGLNAAYVGALPPLLLGLGFFVGMGRGFLRFFALVALLLWGTAFRMPAVEGLVRAVPGLYAVQPTRFLGPVGFVLACGGAMVLDRLCSPGVKPGVLRGLGRVAVTVAAGLLVSAVVLRLPDHPPGARPPTHRLETPNYRRHHGGSDIVDVQVPLAAPVDALRVRLDGRLLFDGPWTPRPGERAKTVTFSTHRLEEGRHRLHVEVERGGRREELADQPLVVRRDRQLTGRDLTGLGVSLAVLAWLIWGRRPRLQWLITAFVAADVLSLTHGYNAASRVDELYPPTRTVDFLRSVPGPFRIFTEGTIVAPDTQFAVGVDHIMSYDNLGYQSTFRLLHNVPMDWDAFARFEFSRQNVDYASHRFDLLDVRYVLTTTSTDLSDIPGMLLVHESETRIWENTDSLGRAWITPAAVNAHATPIPELLALDLRRTTVLEQEPLMSLGGEGRATVVEHGGAHIRVRTETDGDALLVLAENRAPGWTASLDGGPPQPTLAADVAWQAVPVPAGVHEVLFEYSPASYRWGLAISLVAGLALLLMLAFPRQRH